LNLAIGRVIFVTMNEILLQEKYNGAINFIISFKT